MSDNQLAKQVERMARASGLDYSPDVVAEAVKKVLSTLGEGAGRGDTKRSSASQLDAEKDFPLATKRPDLVRSATGLSLSDITLEKVMAGSINFEDLRIRPDTLEYQAQIGESAGRPILASNMRRAGELTRIPDERVLEIYNALRPYRSTKQELLDIAGELDSKYQARVCAALVREAAEEYDRRGRLKR